MIRLKCSNPPMIRLKCRSFHIPDPVISSAQRPGVHSKWSGSGRFRAHTSALNNFVFRFGQVCHFGFRHFFFNFVKSGRTISERSTILLPEMNEKKNTWPFTSLSFPAVQLKKISFKMLFVQYRIRRIKKITV